MWIYPDGLGAPVDNLRQKYYEEEAPISLMFLGDLSCRKRLYFRCSGRVLFLGLFRMFSLKSHCLKIIH
jgi:hypothetical protein